jgi:Protein of unknown function (DUF1559)
MHRSAVLVCLLAVPLLAAAAAPPFDPDARAKAVAPFLDDRSVIVAHVDLTRVDADALAARLAESAKMDVKDLAGPKRDLADLLADLTKAGARDVYCVFSLADLPGTPFLVVPLEGGASAEKIGQRLDRLMLIEGGKSEVRGPALVHGSAATLKRLQNIKETPNADLARAFAAAGDTGVQVLLLPNTDTRRVLNESLPVLPPELGGGPVKTFTHGLQWAALGVDLPPKGSLRLVIQSPDEQSARALGTALGDLVQAIGKQKPVQDALPEFGNFVKALEFKAEGNQVTATVNEKLLLAAFHPGIVKIADDMRLRPSSNNLKQLVLAMHNYHDAHGKFPAAASTDAKGKPLLSWRVQLLPSLGQEALSKEFHLDEPWDSEHNKQLVARMPAVYRCPNQQKGEPGTTTYLAPVGEQTMFPGLMPTKISDVTDGTVNTIFLVEADDAHAVVWTRPEDLKYDPEKPRAGLAGHYANGFLAAFVDGSVHFIPNRIPDVSVHGLFTRNGGEVVEIP